jgi:hypothetical protein
VAAVAAAAVSTAISWPAGYNAGWRHADNARAAGELVRARALNDWLVRAAVKTGALDVNDPAIESANEQIQGAIYETIGKGGLAVSECMSVDFLHGLAKLR